MVLSASPAEARASTNPAAHRSRSRGAPRRSSAPGARADHVLQPEPTRTPSTSPRLKTFTSGCDPAIEGDADSTRAAPAQTGPQAQVQARSGMPTAGGGSHELIDCCLPHIGEKEPGGG